MSFQFLQCGHFYYPGPSNSLAKVYSWSGRNKALKKIQLLNYCYMLGYLNFLSQKASTAFQRQHSKSPRDLAFLRDFLGSPLALLLERSDLDLKSRKILILQGRIYITCQ